VAERPPPVARVLHVEQYVSHLVDGEGLATAAPTETRLAGRRWSETQALRAQSTNHISFGPWSHLPWFGCEAAFKFGRSASTNSCFRYGDFKRAKSKQTFQQWFMFTYLWFHCEVINCLENTCCINLYEIIRMKLYQLEWPYLFQKSSNELEHDF
jgi:hypothetical protein